MDTAPWGGGGGLGQRKGLWQGPGAQTRPGSAHTLEMGAFAEATEQTLRPLDIY